MRTDIDAQVADLLKKPYARVLIPEEGGYSAYVLEFPGCVSAGDTPEEAMENLTEAMQLWLEAVIENGQSVPEPAEATEHSGKLNLRMPKSLHRDAATRAEIDGVSLNQWIVSAVSWRLGAEDALAALVELLGRRRVFARRYAEEMVYEFPLGLANTTANTSSHVRGLMEQISRQLTDAEEKEVTQ